MSIERVETERLTGERISLAHEAELAALLGDPRVGATLGGALDAAASRARLERHIAHWERHGFGSWAWRDSATGAFVANAGPQNVTVGGREEVEVGWAVVPEHWGEGIATEAALASVAVAVEQLGLPDVVAFTTPDNLASRRVMEKAGFVYEREVVHADLPHVLYRARGR
jgi:RimJ/RimL family protein N-acetyltransferase